MKKLRPLTQGVKMRAAHKNDPNNMPITSSNLNIFNKTSFIR